MRWAVLRATAATGAADALTRPYGIPYALGAEASNRSEHIAAAAKRVWVTPVALGSGALGRATGGGDGEVG